MHRPILILSLIFVFLFTACKNKINMNFDTSTQAPTAEQIPYQLKEHGDIRVDNYYWMKERDNPEVIDYLERENDYFNKMTAEIDSFREDLFEELKLKNFVKKGEILINLKSGNIIAPFSGVLGYTGLTEDILVSNNIFIITLDDNSTIYSDIKIPENYSSSIKKGLPVEVKLSSFKDKIFLGEVDFVSSRINADTRSLLSRIKIDNANLELISGSLLEVSVKFNLRNSLSVPDTSVMVEGDKSFVYKINDENIANKTEIKTGLRVDKNIEIISGLNEGDIVVAEGLKKVRPRGKIKPINK